MITVQDVGWIGADVGNAAVKVVQLKRVKRGYQIAASAVISRQQCWNAEFDSDELPCSTADELHAAQSLGVGFRGRRLAAAMPMSLCDVHAVEAPLEQQQSEAVVARTIETIIQKPASDLQLAVWSAEPPTESASVRVTNLISVAANWSDQLCQDVAHSGWSCQTIDGLPFCLARAVDMVDPEASQEPVAALDLGFRRATLCVVLDGRPVYVRGLKSCSFDRLLDAVMNNLNVKQDEAQRLLLEYGVSTKTEEAGCDAAEVIREVVAEPLRQLEEEIARTISHLKGRRPSIVPRQIQLLGGGAAMRGLANRLTEQIRSDIRVWRIDGKCSQEVESDGIPSCLFGPAAALSQLAWEPR